MKITLFVLAYMACAFVKADRVDDMAEKMDEMSGMITLLNRELHEVSKDAQQKISKLENQVAMLTSKNTELVKKQAAAIINVELAKKQAAAITSNKDMQQKISTLDHKVAMLTSENAELVKKQAAAITSNKDTQQKISTLDHQVAILASENGELQKKQEVAITSNKDVHNKIITLDTKVAMLTSENAELKDAMSTQKQAATVAWNDAQQKISKLDRQVAMVTTENAELRKKQVTSNNDAQHKFSLLDRQVAMLTFENAELKKSVSEQKRAAEIAGNNALHSRHSGTVMGTFYATLTNTISISSGYIIVFNNAWYNSGEYSTSTGVFICPVTGVYVFSYTVECASGGCFIYADLYMDTTLITTVYASAVTGSSHGASTTAIVYCSQYSEVMVKYNAGSGSVRGYQQSSFSGFLLQQQ